MTESVSGRLCKAKPMAVRAGRLRSALIFGKISALIVRRDLSSHFRAPASSLDAVRFQFIVDSLDIDPKLPGGFRFVVGSVFEGPNNQLAFGVRHSGLADFECQLSRGNILRAPKYVNNIR
jgi:hypothetical protein